MPTVFLDFDGTITVGDVTDAILEAYAHPQWLAIEESWKAGCIGSRKCLVTQMALVSAARDELDALLDQTEVDSGFLTLLEWCVARTVPVHIVSDGFDYCIRRILMRPSLGLERHLKHLGIVSSHLEPVGSRWRVSFTSPSEGCVHGCATCKPAAMERLKVEGSPAVFVGDGLSDRYAAAAADLVFAKDALAAYCSEQSISYASYSNLATVARGLEGLLAFDPTAPAESPERTFPA